LLVPELPGLGELDRREPTKCAVGSLLIVFVTPVLEVNLRLEEAVGPSVLNGFELHESVDNAHALDEFTESLRGSAQSSFPLLAALN
jgi:hypothetical protein